MIALKRLGKYAGPIRNIDVAQQTEAIRSFVRMAIPVVGMFTIWGISKWGARGVWIGVAIGVLATVVLSKISVAVSGRMAWSFARAVSGWGGRPKSRYEILASEMDLVRHSKGRREYDVALKTVNRVLTEEPELPEALFLKAQILWEGYGNRNAAIGYLRRILEVVPDEERPIHRWASTLQSELLESEDEG